MVPLILLGVLVSYPSCAGPPCPVGLRALTPLLPSSWRPPTYPQYLTLHQGGPVDCDWWSYYVGSPEESSLSFAGSLAMGGNWWIGGCCMWLWRCSPSARNWRRMSNKTWSNWLRVNHLAPDRAKLPAWQYRPHTIYTGHRKIQGQLRQD